MSIREYLRKIKNVHSALLEFLERETKNEESFQYLCSILKSFIIHDKRELRLFLHLISTISNNYHHGNDFISKILRIIEYLKEPIKKHLSNTEIFNLLKNNKRILLFLVENKIIIFDRIIIKNIFQSKYSEAKYPQYFFPEVKPFFNEKWFLNKKYCRYTKDQLMEKFDKEFPENFYEMRRLGENESYICELIRNDSVEEFIAYVNKNNYPLNSKIKSSIYETNPFLIKKQNESKYQRYSYYSSDEEDDNDDKVTLIKYAAFFGSIQIFKYLQMNDVELTPQLWYFAIHGKNAEIIHILEENHIELENLYEECFKEAIKCHYNEIANYFLDNFLPNDDKNKMYSFTNGMKYYNFSFIQYELINENSFIYMCHYDYYYLVYMLFNNKNIDVNAIIIKSFQI